MPTYAYVCTACDHSFEAVQAITDDALTACPSCGGLLRKKFHPVGVTFKGSGFYRTDSRGSSAEGGKTTAASSSEGSTSTSTSDSSSSSKGSGSSSTAPASGSGTSGSSGTSNAGAASS